MENIEKIIEFIIDKTNNEKKTPDLILSEIQEKFGYRLDKINISIEDINFLIDIIQEGNFNLSDINLAKTIFFNSKKKIKHKIIISRTESDLIEFNKKNDNDKYLSSLIDFFTNYGQIFIKPKEIYFLWNFKNQLKYNLLDFEKKVPTSNNSKLSYLTNTKQDSNEDLKEFEKINFKKITSNNINFYIKKVNFEDFQQDIINQNNELEYNNFLNNNFFNKKRTIFVKSNKIFKSNFSLSFVLDNYFYTCSYNDYYSGEIIIYFNNKKFKTNISVPEDFKKILNFYKEDMIDFFNKNKTIRIKYIDLFLNYNILFDHIDIILDSFKTVEKLNIPRLIPKKFIKTKTISDFNIINILKEKCIHFTLLDEIIYNRTNFLEKINKFINEYVYYDNGLAFCNICNQIIYDLNIKGVVFFNKKYTTYYVDFLNYPPYNKFVNVKYFFDNFFYLFTQYTKLVITNNDIITKMFIDNFIQISDQRSNLENIYKLDIEDNNIFFFRLSISFFNKDEKEKFQEKKNIFIIIALILILLTVAPFSDFYELIFLRSIIKINKIYTQETTNYPSFKDVIVAVIILFLKKSSNTFYENLNVKQKSIKIMKTIDIYLDIFDKDFLEIFENKELLFSDFIYENLNNKVDFFINGNPVKEDYNKDYKNGRYILNTVNLKQYYPKKVILDFLKKNSFKKTIIFKEEQFKENKLSDDIITIELEEIDNLKFDKNLLNTLLLELESKKEFVIKNRVCTLIHNQNEFLFLNTNENFLITDENDQEYIVRTTKNSELFEFYTYNDNFLYKSHINDENFENILFNFIKLLELLVNKKINFKFNYLNTYCDRQMLFILKIKIVLYLTKKLNINNFLNLFSDFNKNNDNILIF